MANDENPAAVKKTRSDPIQDAMGQFGRYHAFVVFIVCMLKFPVAWHQISIVYTSAEGNFVCATEGLSSCDAKCKSRVFESSVFTKTIRSEWDLVCDRSQLANLSQSVFMFGVLVGSLVFGAWADMYGRKIPLVVAVCIQVVSGILTSVSTFFWLYCVLRFFTGFATGGTMTASFVIMLELVGLNYREFVTVVFHLPFNLGHCTLPIFAYFLRNWQWLQFGLSIPSILLISYFWLVPESPRWLFTHNRLDESIAVISKAARFNRLPTDEIDANIRAFKAVSPQPGKKGTIIDLLRTRNLRCRTFALWYSWFVCGLNYYGLSQYVGQLGGNIFKNVAISASIGIPGTIVSFFLMRYIGRRWTLLLANLITGIACLLIVLLMSLHNVKNFEEDLYALGTLICASFGIIGMNIAFPTVYLYSTEVFPTVVRNVGVGSASMICRIGTIVAPFVATVADKKSLVPPLVFAIIPICGAILVIFLPETKGLELPQTLEEGEQLGVKPKKT